MPRIVTQNLTGTLSNFNSFSYNLSVDTPELVKMVMVTQIPGFIYRINNLVTDSTSSACPQAWLPKELDVDISSGTIDETNHIVSETVTIDTSTGLLNQDNSVEVTVYYPSAWGSWGEYTCWVDDVQTSASGELTLNNNRFVRVPVQGAGTHTVVVQYSVPTVTLTSPANNAVYLPGAGIPLSAGVSSGTITKVVFYADNTALDTDTSSPYDCTWANASIGIHSLTAKAYNSAGDSATSDAVSIRVDAPPAAGITSPTNSAVILGNSVTIQATATDTDGAISKVEFYQGGFNLIGTLTASPYTCTWTPVSPGVYTLTARAYDNDGAVTTSTPAINIRVDNPPAVSITSPAEGALFTSSGSVSITANATDTDGTINKVVFYQDNTFLDTETVDTPTGSHNYRHTWTNVPSGSHSLTAKAYDNNGAVTTSSEVSITDGSVVDTETADTPTTYVYNQNNQLLFEITGTDTTGYDTTAFTYDLNGNLVQKTTTAGTTTYTYDYENRLISISGPGLSVSYTYDAEGNRISKTENGVTTKYINDIAVPLVQVLQEVTGCDTAGYDTITYVYGNDLISQTRNSSTIYYLYDGLGSTRMLADSSGTTTSTYTYEAFGNLIASTGTDSNNYLFTGESWDAGVGLLYLRARYYNPAVGRFMARDPIGYGGGINLYAYCGNNPVNAVDPSGLDCCPANKKEIDDMLLSAASNLGDITKEFGKGLSNIQIQAIGTAISAVTDTKDACSNASAAKKICGNALREVRMKSSTDDIKKYACMDCCVALTSSLPLKQGIIVCPASCGFVKPPKFW